MSPDFLPTSMGFLVNRLAREFHAAFTSALATVPGGMTSAQFAVLQDIYEHPGSSQKEISKRTGMDVATLTELLLDVKATTFSPCASVGCPRPSRVFVGNLHAEIGEGGRK